MFKKVFKKVLSWVVTVVMMFSVFFTMPITANAEDTFFYEDFEGYAENAYPSSFTMKYNGTGDANQKVITTEGWQGSDTKVFRLQGASSWAAEHIVAVPSPLPSTLVVSAYVKPVSGQWPGRIGLYNPTVGTWGTRVSGVLFDQDGDITVIQNGNDNSKINLGKYTMNNWYHVKMEHNMTAKTYTVYIDGTKVGTDINMHQTVSPTHLDLTAGNIGTNEIYFDNVLVAASDTTAPVLTAGAASRISDTKATVTFTSNEAGQYYFAVVEKDADEPVIETGSSGTVCDTTEQTITLDSLTPGAKDIYIVVKDAAGNISEKLKINIESFNGLTAYGWVAYDAGTGINTGPFTVSIPTGSLQSIKNVEHYTIWMSGGDFVGDAWYAVNYSYTDNSGLYIIDQNTGDYTLVGYTGKSLHGFTYNHINDVAYVIEIINDTSSNLYTIDLTTAEVTLVGPIGDNVIIGIAADNAGNLYGIDIIYDQLLAIDHTSGTGTAIGNIGLDLKYAQDICFDRDNNILYGTLYSNSEQGGLYSIDTSSGTATLKKLFAAEVDAFAIPYVSNVIPTLTAGEVTRTGDTDATVKFTSSRAGQYYYAIVDSGEPEPVIDTGGSGTACTREETTISLNSLTAGDKDIYIKVKDRFGNMSTALKISIPAYIPPVPGIIQFDCSGLGTYEGANLYIYVERVGGTDGIVSVDYTATDGTAKAGINYNPPYSGTLTWGDGDGAKKQIPYRITDDSTYNGYLDYTYTLSNPTGGATLGKYITLPVQISDNDNPPTPTGLAAAAGDGEVTLTWDEVNIAYYKLYYSTISGEFTEENSVGIYSGTSYTWTSLTNGTPYYFAIKAGHNIYFSPLSSEVTATPTAPTYALTVTAGEGGTVTGGGSFAAGETPTITATAESGYKFSGWTSSDGVIFADAKSAVTTITMPANAVTVTANFVEVPLEKTEPEKDGEVEVTVETEKPTPSDEATLPKTGGTPVGVFYGFGMLITAIGAVISFRNKKQ